MRIIEKIHEIPIVGGGTSNRITIPPLGYLTELRLSCKDLAITAADGTGWIEDAGMNLFARIEVLAGGSVIRSLSGRAAWNRWRMDHRHAPHYALGAYDGGGELNIVIPIEFTAPRSFNPLATAVPVKWFGRDGVVLQVTFGAATDISDGTATIDASQVVDVVAVYEESLTVEPRHFRTMYETIHVCDAGAASQEAISLDDRDGLRSIMFICTDAASDHTKDATMGNHSTWRLFGAAMGESRKRIIESHYRLVWRDTLLDAGLPEITHDGDLATPTVIHGHHGIIEHHFDPHGQLDALNVRSKMSGLDLETLGVNAAADKIFYTTEQIEVIPAMLNP